MNPKQPDGYLAIPPAGKGPGVLVLHAWWGLNDTIKSMCNRLAASGFAAFAPDLYHGKLAETIADAEILSGELFANLDASRADVLAAQAFLSGHAATGERPLAVIGFSLGAFFSLDLSVTAPEHVHSVVIFYGTRPGEYHNSRAAYLGHFAEVDEFEPHEEVVSLEESLRRAGRPVTFYQYPGTGHWFFEPDRVQAYHPASASLAWDRTLAFLSR